MSVHLDRVLRHLADAEAHANTGQHLPAYVACLRAEQALESFARRQHRLHREQVARNTGQTSLLDHLEQGP